MTPVLEFSGQPEHATGYIRWAIDSELVGTLLLRDHKSPLAADQDRVLLSLVYRITGEGDKEEERVLETSLAFDKQEPTEGGIRLPFSLRLPLGPLGYGGTLFVLQWFVQVRVSLHGERTQTLELPLDLVDGPGPSDPYRGPSHPPNFEEALGRSYKRKYRPAHFTLGERILSGLFLVLFLFGMAYLLDCREHRSDERLKDAGFVTAIFLLPLILPLGAWIGKRLATWRMGVPTCEVFPDTLRPGEQVSVRFQRSQSSLFPRQIYAELLGKEIARGRKNRKEKILHLERIPLSESGARVSEVSFVVPRSAPTTFAGIDHEVRWSVRIYVDLPWWPDWKEDILLSIIPKHGSPSGTFSN